MTSASDIPDWALVARVKAGDDGAFTELIGRYQRPILDFVYRMIGDAVEAQDVAQGVFARAYRQIRESRLREGRARFSTWLFQVARHAALDGLRRRRRHPAESLTQLEQQGARVADAGPRADQAAVAHEIGDRIAAAVARLPPDQRAVVVLSEYENLSDAEIADVMHCSVKSVESRLYRAKRSLRQALSDLMP